MKFLKSGKSLQIFNSIGKGLIAIINLNCFKIFMFKLNISMNNNNRKILSKISLSFPFSLLFLVFYKNFKKKFQDVFLKKKYLIKIILTVRLKCMECSSIKRRFQKSKLSYQPVALFSVFIYISMCTSFFFFCFVRAVTVIGFLLIKSNFIFRKIYLLEEKKSQFNFFLFFFYFYFFLLKMINVQSKI